MSNPLYESMNQSNNFLTRFNQFKQSINGDPRQQIQNMLNSGKISQAQYNNAVQRANALMKNFNQFL